LAVASRNAAGGYVGCEGLGGAGELGRGSAGSNSPTRAPLAWPQQRGWAAMPKHRIAKRSPNTAAIAALPAPGSSPEVAGLIRRVWDLLLYPRYRTSALG